MSTLTLDHHQARRLRARLAELKSHDDRRRGGTHNGHRSWVRLFEGGDNRKGGISEPTWHKLMSGLPKRNIRRSTILKALFILGSEDPEGDLLKVLK